MLDEHTAKKVRTHREEGKEARARLVGEEGSIQQNCFAVEICDGELLWIEGRQSVWFRLGMEEKRRQAAALQTNGAPTGSGRRCGKQN